jgi:hypothetical protein
MGGVVRGKAPRRPQLRFSRATEPAIGLAFALLICQSRESVAKQLPAAFVRRDPDKARTSIALIWRGNEHEFDSP